MRITHKNIHTLHYFVVAVVEIELELDSLIVIVDITL